MEIDLDISFKGASIFITEVSLEISMVEDLIDVGVGVSSQVEAMSPRGNPLLFSLFEALMYMGVSSQGHLWH